MELLQDNIGLIILSVLAVVVTAGIALLFTIVKRMSDRMEAIEKRAGDTATPFWQYAFRVVAGDLIHPHDRYEEADILIKEALLEPVIRMPPDRAARLDVLLDKRMEDTSSDMRPGEQNKAKIFKLMLEEVRREAESDMELTNITVVGSQAPEAQKGEEGEEGEEGKV